MCVLLVPTMYTFFHSHSNGLSKCLLSQGMGRGMSMITTSACLTASLIFEHISETFFFSVDKPYRPETDGLLSIAAVTPPYPLHPPVDSNTSTQLICLESWQPLSHTGDNQSPVQPYTSFHYIPLLSSSILRLCVCVCCCALWVHVKVFVCITVS